MATGKGKPMAKKSCSFGAGFCLIMVLFLAGCGPKMVAKINKFPHMYEEMPASILILPPMNETTAADAKEYYSTTIQEPLSFSGYYVFPFEVTAEILKMEGLYDTELIRNTPLPKFREYFGAEYGRWTSRVDRQGHRYRHQFGSCGLCPPCPAGQLSCLIHSALWKISFPTFERPATEISGARPEISFDIQSS